MHQSRKEGYRKEQQQLEGLTGKAKEIIVLLENANLALDFLVNCNVDDTAKQEADAAASLSTAFGLLDKLTSDLSHIAARVWEARSPNGDIFAQETAAWQRSHPESEWYSDDYRKNHEKH